MKKIVSITMFLTLIFSAKMFSQTWTYQGVFPPGDTLSTVSGVQFITVDPDGKIWIAPYSNPKDSVFIADSSKYFRARRLYVFNPDGTPWDTIKSATVGGVTYPFSSTGYGLTRDNNGNILYCNASTLYRLNYKTGEGMNRVTPGMGSLTSPAVDGNGNVYLAPVLPGRPIKIYDTDLNFIGNAVDTVTGYGRWIAVSKDGNTLYVPRFTENKLTIYHRPDEFSPYAKDSALAGIAVESGTWDPVDGNLWMSAGSYQAQPQGDFAGREGTWLSFNPQTWEIKDSIKWQYNVPQNADERPRGIAFSNDGTTAYVVIFGTGEYPPVQVFNNPEHKVTGVRELSELPAGYTLSQNYPNPFNPTTMIKFSVPETGFVTLKVYNTLGQEVATLVNEEKRAGSYEVDFNASNLASGVYMYTLSAGKVTLSKKMLLVK